ncbi:MAG: alpha/beta fold hydrolase [Flavobacteriaceae bacterium]
MEKFTLYKGAEIHYSENGKGSVVVLLHGFLENQTMWNFLIDKLSKKHRVFAFDLLGHGKSESIGYIHTMEEQADMVYAVLYENKIRKATLIGHSMGGYVALAFAELYPDVIKKIVLVNSTARADSAERRLNRDRAIQAVKQNFSTFVKMSITNLFSEKNRKKRSKEIEEVKKQALKTPIQGIIAALEGMKIRNDREVMLHFAPYPMMLILGTEDSVLNYEDNKDQTENTQVKLVSLESGHMSHLENTDELIENIVTFLK